MSVKQIANPQGAFGVTDVEQQQFQAAPAYKSAGVITAKCVVAIGTDGTVTQATTGTTASLCFGIALEAATTNESVRVATMGVVTGVTAQGAIAASDILKRSATTGGALAATATPGVGEALAVAIAASSGGTVSVLVVNGK